MTQEEFENNYECYETDLKKNKGVKPWDSQEREVIPTDDQTKFQNEGEER